jgi:hypothetical protein
MFLSKPEKEPYTIPSSFVTKLFVLILVIPVLVFGIYFGPLLDIAKSCLILLGI